MEILKIRPNDILEMKKPHPCGSRNFRVLRVGSEIRVICLGCGRDMTLDRIRLEKATKKIIFSENTEE